MTSMESRGLAIAVVAAFAASMLAISGHADQVEQGYRLAAARREGEVLLREALQAERRVAALSVPTAVVHRATAMQLGLGLSKDRRELSEEQVAALLAPPAASPAKVPSAAPGRSAEVMAR